MLLSRWKKSWWTWNLFLESEIHSIHCAGSSQIHSKFSMIRSRSIISWNITALGTPFMRLIVLVILSCDQPMSVDWSLLQADNFFSVVVCYARGTFTTVLILLQLCDIWFLYVSVTRIVRTLIYLPTLQTFISADIGGTNTRLRIFEISVRESLENPCTSITGVE